MKTAAANRRDAGFTLLELLVALVVLGFILAGLSQGAHFGLQAIGAQTRDIAGRGDLDAVDRALHRLIEAADPGQPRDPPTFRGSASSLAFVSTLPAAARLPTRQAQVSLGVDGSGRLVLRAVPRLPGHRLGPLPAPSETELLRGVDHLDAAYWTRGADPHWVTAWTSAGLPALVRLRVVFPPGDRRHWPDIVAALKREAPPGS